MPYVTKRKKIRSLVNTQVYTGPHNSLAGRDALNCHPIQSITGLQAALDELIDGAGTVGRVAGFTASKTIGNTPMRFNTTSMGIGTDDLEELLNLHKDSAEDVLIALSNSNTGLFPLEVGVDNTGKGKIELGSYEDGKTIQMQAQTLDMLTDNFLLRRVISGIESKRVLGVDTTGKVEQTGVVYDSGSLTATNLTANTAVNGATITASGYVNSPVYLVGGVQIAPADIAGLQATLNSFMTLGGPIQFTPSNPDLNTLGNNEFVAAIASTTALNRPGNYYTVVNFPGSMSAGGNQRNFQLASYYAGTNTNIFQMRSRQDTTGEWADWVELWHSGNLNPADYLPLSGGSVTGELRIEDDGIINLNNRRTDFVTDSTQSYIYTTLNAAGNPFPFDGTVNRNLIIQGRSSSNSRHIVFVTGNPPDVRADINASRSRFWQDVQVDGNLQVAGSTFLSSLSIGTHTNVVETQNEIIYTGNTATSSDITDITLPTGWDANKLAVVYAGVRGTQTGGASWFLHGSSAVDVRLFEVIDNPDVLRITVTQPSGVTLRDRAYRVILRRTVQ